VFGVGVDHAQKIHFTVPLKSARHRIGRYRAIADGCLEGAVPLPRARSRWL